MTKPEETRFRWTQWLFPVTCLLAAVAALVAAFYVQASITSLYKRLDEQRESISQLYAKFPEDHAPDFTQEPETSDPIESESSDSGVRCMVGEGCRTTDGDVFPSPTAHLVANKTEGLLMWSPELLFGGMRALGPHLIVPLTGNYFVYCQVQYSDSMEYKHSLLVNAEPVWSNIKSHYQAGLLHLNANDSVTVLPDPSTSSYITHGSSYFGAFLYADVYSFSDN